MGATVLAVGLAALALVMGAVLYWALTNALVMRLLQAHGALMALRRRHPAGRALTYVPLKMVVGLARYAQWWLAFRRDVARGWRGR
jgi:hypothetical protein